VASGERDEGTEDVPAVDADEESEEEKGDESRIVICIIGRPLLTLVVDVPLA
jgi:hypothetical protein